MAEILHRGFDPVGSSFVYWEANRYDPTGLQYGGVVPFVQLVDVTIVDIDEFRTFGDFSAGYRQRQSADIGLPTEGTPFFSQVGFELPIVYTSLFTPSSDYNVSTSNQSDLTEFFEV